MVWNGKALASHFAPVLMVSFIPPPSPGTLREMLWHAALTCMLTFI